MFFDKNDNLFMYSGISTGSNRILRLNKGETNVEVIAGNGDGYSQYDPKGAGQESLDATNTYIGAGFSMRMDSFGDIYIINSNDGGNAEKGGLFVLGQPNITDYTQPTGTHQKLNISNDLNNPLGGILNIRNNRTDAGIRNDHAGSIEFSSADRCYKPTDIC